jgi:Ni/Co efflux regulator RcnB
MKKIAAALLLALTMTGAAMAQNSNTSAANTNMGGAKHSSKHRKHRKHRRHRRHGSKTMTTKKTTGNTNS